MMRAGTVLFVFFVALGACSSPPEPECVGEACDPAPADMARPPGGVDPSCTTPRGTLWKSVVSRLVMPTVDEPCAIDVDGDGLIDNALRGVVAGLRAAAFDLQANADAVLRSGELVQLVTLQSEDPTNSSCAHVTLRRGLRPDKPPALDGSDTFAVDAAIAPAQLWGTIAGGQLETPRPQAQTAATLVRLQLSLPGGFGVEVPLPLLGAHLSGRVGVQGLVSGQLHGVVRMSDVETRMIPAIAQVMTALIRRQPDSPSARHIIATFETRAKCEAKPALCCRTSPQTCEITAEEVRNNAQVKLILKPDVQMFSGDVWSPTPGGDAPDSLSIGLCFTAVTARF
ncbi:MAG: hypothetical protein RMK29_05615 [Myxococcales bacterium]|nr:hypothetical protein [Myxococcota bacterium]MDW8281167.1 hypothetical protein [Myxococcales bacterium]